MSMTREELQQWFAEWLDDYYDELYSEDDLTPEVAESALAALRPVSREQVEKVWRGEWTVDEFGHKCSKCGEYLPDGEDVRKPQFCPECGRAMTDEDVQMVMERLEALYGDR